MLEVSILPLPQNSSIFVGYPGIGPATFEGIVRLTNRRTNAFLAKSLAVSPKPLTLHNLSIEFRATHVGVTDITSNDWLVSINDPNDVPYKQSFTLVGDSVPAGVVRFSRHVKNAGTVTQPDDENVEDDTWTPVRPGENMVIYPDQVVQVKFRWIIPSETAKKLPPSVEANKAHIRQKRHGNTRYVAVAVASYWPNASAHQTQGSSSSSITVLSAPESIRSVGYNRSRLASSTSLDEVNPEADTNEVAESTTITEERKGFLGSLLARARSIKSTPLNQRRLKSASATLSFRVTKYERVLIQKYFNQYRHELETDGIPVPEWLPPWKPASNIGAPIIDVSTNATTGAQAIRTAEEAQAISTFAAEIQTMQIALFENSNESTPRRDQSESSSTLIAETSTSSPRSSLIPVSAPPAFTFPKQIYPSLRLAKQLIGHNRRFHYWVGISNLVAARGGKIRLYFKVSPFEEEMPQSSTSAQSPAGSLSASLFGNRKGKGAGWSDSRPHGKRVVKLRYCEVRLEEYQQINISTPQRVLQFNDVKSVAATRVRENPDGELSMVLLEVPEFSPKSYEYLLAESKNDRSDGPSIRSFATGSTSNLTWSNPGPNPIRSLPLPGDGRSERAHFSTSLSPVIQSGVADLGLNPSGTAGPKLKFLHKLRISFVAQVQSGGPIPATSTIDLEVSIAILHPTLDELLLTAQNMPMLIWPDRVLENERSTAADVEEALEALGEDPLPMYGLDQERAVSHLETMEFPPVPPTPRASGVPMSTGGMNFLALSPEVRSGQ
ncbi:hypothetical protein BJ742DRAFT_800077 [Cladochytrium replicatum]|nr:hypothetical protein BJ742DRAFT_800077 [Cladochytrium replicatum]